MKDGRILCGPLWEWRPCDGWFSITTEDDLEVIQIPEVESAVERGERVGISSVPGAALLADTDLVKKAEAQIAGHTCCHTHNSAARREGLPISDDASLYTTNRRPDDGTTPP